MSQDKMTYEDLLQLVELMKTAERFSEFHIKVGDLEVTLRRDGVPQAAAPHMAHAAPAAPVAVPAPPPPPLPSSAAAPGIAADAYPADSILIRSPMVGTFYRAPEPGARPFTDVGRHVESDTTVCIIEVMKLMNSIPARCKGTVTHILVADAAPVEYGQVLLVIRPE